MKSHTVDVPRWLAHAHAQRCTGKLIGKRGLTRVGALPIRARKKDLAAIGRECRRKGVSLRAATDAACAWHAELHLMELWRAEMRGRIIRRNRDRMRASGINPSGWYDLRARWQQPMDSIARWHVSSTADLAARLDTQRRLDIAAQFERAITYGAVAVTWHTQADECGVSVDSEQDSRGYGKSCKFPKTSWDIQVRAQKLRRAQLPGGKREIDGLVTLAADPVAGVVTVAADPIAGTDGAWSAVWTEKSRGVSWHVRRGYIVEQGGDVVHGRTLADALGTLRRRQTAAQRQTLAALGLSRAEVMKNYGDRRLSWSLARRAGLCEDGIRAWVARNFPTLDARHDTVTVRDALNTGDSTQLVMRAIGLLHG